MIGTQVYNSHCMPMAKALFSGELEGALRTLHHQFWVVRTYAEAYINDVGADEAFTVKVQRALFESQQPGQGGEVSEAIDTSVATIERICLPKLSFEDA